MPVPTWGQRTSAARIRGGRVRMGTPLIVTIVCEGWMMTCPPWTHVTTAAAVIIAGTAGDLDETFAYRRRHRLRAAAGVELRHHVVDHVLDGSLAVAEALGDLTGRVPVRDEAEHLLLTDGERREREAARLEQLVLGARDRAEEVAEEIGREDAGAGRGRAEARDERVGGQRLLPEVADGAGLDGGEKLSLVGAPR